MIQLWGNEACTTCRQAVNYLSKTPITWEYVDVAKTKFEGEIPRLVLEDGTHIVGFPKIIKKVKLLLNEMGF